LQAFVGGLEGKPAMPILAIAASTRSSVPPIRRRCGVGEEADRRGLAKDALILSEKRGSIMPGTV
jgi:hypothetical protein